MMEKLLTFSTHDSLGRCFAETIDLHGTKGHEKIAGDLDPKIQEFINSIKSDPRYQYVLMTPMGAFEFWGANQNGDIFPEISLSHCHKDNDPEPVIRELEEKYLKPHGKSMPPFPRKEFGFRTFEKALRYREFHEKK